MQAPTKTFYSVPISISATGDTIIVPSQATAPIKVWLIGWGADANTTIKLKAGSRDLSGYYPIQAYGTFQWDYRDVVYYTCLPGEAFIINQSGSANVGGTVWYTLG